MGATDTRNLRRNANALARPRVRMDRLANIHSVGDSLNRQRKIVDAAGTDLLLF